MIALFATLGVGYVGAGGLGFYLMQQVKLMEYGKLSQGIFVLGVTALILDLVFGVIQFRVSRDPQPFTME